MKGAFEANAARSQDSALQFLQSHQQKPVHWTMSAAMLDSYECMCFRVRPDQWEWGATPSILHSFLGSPGYYHVSSTLHRFYEDLKPRLSVN